MKKGLLTLAVVIVTFLLMFGIVVSMRPCPVEIGKVVKNANGEYEFKMDWMASTDHKLPMFVLDYDATNQPMWGFVLLDNTNDIAYVINLGFKPVAYGNFMDMKYTGLRMHPIWSDEGFIDPVGRAKVDGVPKTFYIPVWLDKRS
ncbi:MAG: hypothetical protein QG640_537 [Patescibacteria group bacterium]|nr:hypothetical protein [Patescibacteria group bacterium]